MTGSKVLLTTTSRTRTDVPFVEVVDGSNGEPEFQKSVDRKIVIESVSEMMDYDFPGSKFTSNGSIKLIHDSVGQPLIFSIGTDQHLYMMGYINGMSHGWQSFDITPNPDCEVSTYDVGRDGNRIFIVVASRSTSTVIQHATIPLSALSGGKDTFESNPFSDVSWVSVEKNIAQFKVSTLACSPSKNGSYETAFQLVATVEATKDTEAAPYTFASGAPSWTLVAMPTSAEVIRACVSARFPAPLGPGRILLVESEGSDRAISCLFQGDGVAKQLFLTGAGRPISVSPNENYRGYTDIFAATDNGICFFDHTRLGRTPKILGSGIGFKEVVSSESIGPEEDTAHIQVVAISSHNELFFFQGSRSTTSKTEVSWTESNVPIRTGVMHVACHYNRLSGACELVYASSSHDEIRHLSRDPRSSMWCENVLSVTSAGDGKQPKTTKRPASISTVTLHDGDGDPVPFEFEAYLSAEPALALINGAAYNLDGRPQKVPTNELGQLKIVLPLQHGIYATDIKISAESPHEQVRTHHVRSCSRALQTFNSIKEPSDLKNAVTTDGRPLFDEFKKKSLADESLKSAVSVFKMIPSISQSQDTLIPLNVEAEDIILCWEKTPEGKSTTTEHSWISDAMDVAGDFLGDVLEFLKKAVKTVVKLAMKIAGPVIMFIIRIGARVIRFALRTIGQLLSCIPDILDVLGVDTSAMRDWLTFHYVKVEETQKELTWAINKTLDLSAEFVQVQIPILLKLVDELDPFLETIISRPIERQEKPQSRQSILTRILNNPIISRLLEFNPVSWILEAVTEELDIQVPRTSFAFLSNAMEAMGDVFDELGRLVLNILDRLGSGLMSNPTAIGKILMDCLRSSIWTIYDSFKKVAGTVFSSASELFIVFKDFLQETWVVPGLTDLWEDLTGCPFSAINFITYVSAQVLELFGRHGTVMESLRVFRQLLEGCGDFQKAEVPQFNDLKRDQSMTDSRSLEAPSKKTKLQTNSIVTLCRSLNANNTTPNLLTATTEARMVSNQKRRLLSADDGEASNDKPVSTSEDTGVNEESKKDTDSDEKETKTPDAVIKAIAWIRALTSGFRLVCVVLEGLSSRTRAHRVGDEGGADGHAGQPAGPADPLRTWQRVFSISALVGATLEWIIRNSLYTDSAKEVTAGKSRTAHWVILLFCTLMSCRGNERLASTSNIVYGLGKSITSFWLEEGGARIAEMTGGILTCGAGAAFMCDSKAAKIVGGVLTAGDLGCCIAVFISSEKDLKEAIHGR
ncbi:hypothetical protein PDE_09697 [Penicillium oxalicum 114-2]|uniref:Uncharacterized protein n=1 Tax=Penicillium oxalicum (strain 114-2 / CGMCC 5302) TaxID=933388 RepID=S8B733_PENO1|nr:hypothetical protein PDE_09697 [Penicillium oxalicum 114-2]